jgi:hypothetical protein
MSDSRVEPLVGPGSFHTEAGIAMKAKALRGDRRFRLPDSW